MLQLLRLSLVDPRVLALAAAHALFLLAMGSITLWPMRAPQLLTVSPIPPRAETTRSDIPFSPAPRNLFQNRVRSEPAIPVPVSSAEPKPATPKLAPQIRVTGIILSPASAPLVLLEVEENGLAKVTVRAKLGDSVYGYRVSKIEGKQVSLSSGSEEMLLTLKN
jgi:hypothetical protein